MILPINVSDRYEGVEAMAMQNMYNYKKPANYHNQIKDLKNEPVAVVRQQTPKDTGNGYMEQKIMHAKPEELTLMLYDGIVKFLKQAKLFMEQRDIEKTSNALIRAQDIIDELNITLNMDYEVSQNLRSLYVFMNTQLAEANAKKDKGIIDGVLNLVTELRDTWKEAMGLAKTPEKQLAE